MEKINKYKKKIKEINNINESLIIKEYKLKKEMKNFQDENFKLKIKLKLFKSTKSNNIYNLSKSKLIYIKTWKTLKIKIK